MGVSAVRLPPDQPRRSTPRRRRCCSCSCSARCATREASAPDDGARRTRVSWAAFAGAALFAVHPIQSETAGYVSSRSEILCGLFLMSALLLARIAKLRTASGSRRGIDAAAGVRRARSCRMRGAGDALEGSRRSLAGVAARLRVAGAARASRETRHRAAGRVRPARPHHGADLALSGPLPGGHRRDSGGDAAPQSADAVDRDLALSRADARGRPGSRSCTAPTR